MKILEKEDPKSARNFDLGNLRILNNCPRNHLVIGLMDGDFCVCEVHLPIETSWRDIDEKVRAYFGGQL